MQEMTESGLVYKDKSGNPVTNSLIIAEKFGKQHKDVLRAIRNLECSQEFTERNFALSEYIDPTGRSLQMYEMTRDGFAFLVFGFTGKKAAEWTERFIQVFNEMESTLISSMLAMNKAMDITMQTAENIQAMVAHTALITTDITETKQQVEDHDNRIVSLEEKVGDLRVRTQRKPFAESVKWSYREVVKRYFRNMCPCCQRNQVIGDDGKLLSTGRYEHWYDRDRAWETDGWIVCHQCNIMLERERHKHTNKFDLFQERLEELQGPREQIPLL